MADDADITAERDALEAPARLAASKRDPGPPPTGQCHWCHAPVAVPRRYCEDDDCAEVHQRQLRQRGFR